MCAGESSCKCCWISKWIRQMCAFLLSVFIYLFLDRKDAFFSFTHNPKAMWSLGVTDKCLFHGRYSRFSAATPSPCYCVRFVFDECPCTTADAHPCLFAIMQMHVCLHARRWTGVSFCSVQQETHNAQMTDVPAWGWKAFVSLLLLLPQQVCVGSSVRTASLCSRTLQHKAASGGRRFRCHFKASRKEAKRRFFKN